MWHPWCDFYAITFTWVWSLSKHFHLEVGFCIIFLRHNGGFHFVTREEAFSAWLILHFCSQYRLQSPFSFYVERSELLDSESQGQLEMVKPGVQQSQNSVCPPPLQQPSSWTHPVWSGGLILPLSNSWFHSLTFSLLPVILESIHFHKWKLILSKQMLVSIFYILEKKYEYDWLEEGAIQGWEEKCVQTLVEAQLGLKLAPNWELQAVEMGSPKEICCIIKYSLKIFWQEALANFPHILD